MNTLRVIADKLNHLPLFRLPVRVWGERFSAPSADRLLHLWLHKTGIMGREIRTLIDFYVKPGMRVADVGANQGVVTALLSKAVGEIGVVYAFEPDPTLFATVSRNAALNRWKNVQAHAVALGEAAGAAVLQRSAFNSGDNRLRPVADGALGVATRVVRMDEVVQPPTLDFVKIDVQGFEAHVLRGMRGVIEQSPTLTILLEFWPVGLKLAGTDPLDLARLLFEYGFVVSSASDAQRVPLTMDDFTRLANEVESWHHIDLLAIKGPR